MDNGQMTGVVFLDLKKAFDTVNHNILLNKLNTFNLADQSISWFKNYLQDRFQSVKHQGETSSKLPLTCGVPQGSILGPLLFILYINDLSNYLIDSSISLYADDTALYATATTQVELMLNFRVELTIVTEWLKANRLTLNAKKTKYVIFGTKQQLKDKPDLHLTVGNEPIEWVTSTKYLGMILDDHLTFEEHINYVHSKA